MLDIRILNGTIVDGTGSKSAKADLGIVRDKVEVVGNLQEVSSRTIVDASGCIVCPGFVDIHSHSDGEIHDYPGLPSKLRQGVTTEVLGNCGYSAAPYDPAWLESARRQYPWTDVPSFFSHLESNGTGTNVALLVGHGNLRMSTIGPAARKATQEDIEAMKSLLRQCLDAGCAGMSSGLIYPPGMFADEHELSALASLLPASRLYSTHVRNEASHLKASLAEAFRTAEGACARLQVSHLKACGRDVWGSIPEVLAMFEEREKTGMDIGFDAYPYNATQTGLRQLFPPWTQDGGRLQFVSRLKDRQTRAAIVREIQAGDTSWENILVSAGPDNIIIGGSRSGKHDGKTLTEIATCLGVPAVEAACEIAIAEEGEAGIITFEMSPADVELVLSHRMCCICSDGSGYPEEYPHHVHPRNYGAFARFLSEYVLSNTIVPLEEGIRRMTSLPAHRANIAKRGAIVPGYYADVLVLDPHALRANADFDSPRRYATGFRHVLVNGKTAVQNDCTTGALSGVVLRF